MKKRMSGSRMAEGDAYAALRDGVWQLDVDAVKARTEAYLSEAAEAGRYSLAGLCLKLDITREVLELWRRGYASRADWEAGLVPNAALADCIARAMLHLQRVLGGERQARDAGPEAAGGHRRFWRAQPVGAGGRRAAV